MTSMIRRAHFAQYRHTFNEAGILKAHDIRETTPTPKRVVDLVSQIPWNWINKEIYDADILPDRIIDQNMRLFDLLDDGKEVGYCIGVTPEKNIQNAFLGASKHLNPYEIENIALFPNQEGRGRGRSFLKRLMREFFDDQHNPIYLNVSETNHPHLPQFYTRAGMTLVGYDRVPDFNQRRRDHAYQVA